MQTPVPPGLDPNLERIDFAERMLAERRERKLGAG